MKLSTRVKILIEKLLTKFQINTSNIRAVRAFLVIFLFRAWSLGVALIFFSEILHNSS